jgi:hypothetical protein
VFDRAKESLTSTLPGFSHLVADVLKFVQNSLSAAAVDAAQTLTATAAADITGASDFSLIPHRPATIAGRHCVAQQRHYTC